MKSALGLCVLALCLPVAAQAQTGSPLRPAPPSVVGRVLTLDECVAIALETQPQIQATLSDYAAARYRVNQAYTNVLFAQRLIRVQEAALQRAELNLKSTMGMYQAGVRPKSDVARAAVDVANAKVSLIQARNALKTARVALNTSMAIEVD